MKKYKLTNNIKSFDGVELRQIKALKDIDIPRSARQIKKDDLGGYVENEENLSQQGQCWIDEDSCVLDNAKVSQKSFVKSSIISYNATVKGFAKVSKSYVSDSATVKDSSSVENSKISGKAIVGKSARVLYSSKIGNYAKVMGSAEIKKSTIKGNVTIKGSNKICNSTIKEDAIIGGFTEINNCIIYGDATIITGELSDIKYTGIPVFENACIFKTPKDYMIFEPLGPHRRKLTAILGKDGKIYFSVSDNEGMVYDGKLERFKSDTIKCKEIVKYLNYIWA